MQMSWQSYYRTAKRAGGSGKVDRQRPKLEQLWRCEDLFGKMQVFKNPESCPEQNLMGSAVVRIAAASNRLMFNSYRSCFDLYDPLGTAWCKIRRMKVPFFIRSAAIAPACSQ